MPNSTLITQELVCPNAKKHHPENPYELLMIFNSQFFPRRFHTKSHIDTPLDFTSFNTKIVGCDFCFYDLIKKFFDLKFCDQIKINDSRLKVEHNEKKFVSLDLIRDETKNILDHYIYERFVDFTCRNIDSTTYHETKETGDVIIIGECDFFQTNVTKYNGFISAPLFKIKYEMCSLCWKNVIPEMVSVKNKVLSNIHADGYDPHNPDMNQNLMMNMFTGVKK